MRSQFSQFLHDMQDEATKENTIVEARHYDVLKFYFQSNMKPIDAFENYKKFKERWNAITENGKYTETDKITSEF